MRYHYIRADEKLCRFAYLVAANEEHDFRYRRSHSKVGSPAYVAAKGALKQLTKSLAVDLGQFGIRVNSIGPGYFKTDMTQSSWNDPQLQKDRTRHTILGRWGEPDDLTGAVIFLASDASSYITGQDLYVDGGWLAKGLLT